MTTTQDAATIAASIDLASVAGHNLRALLLRLLDGEDWAPSAHHEQVGGALRRADACDLLDIDCRLTPLGREVAELLRPNPWRVEPWGKDWAVFKGGLAPHPTLVAAGNFSGSMGGRGACDRIAALLTQDDLRAAKTYRTEPDQ
jgi:hypothetical protein